ncbi:hypothetical protein GCM10020370_65730 [Paenibacillus hodogayensis]
MAVKRGDGPDVPLPFGRSERALAASGALVGTKGGRCKRMILFYSDKYELLNIMDTKMFAFLS